MNGDQIAAAVGIILGLALSGFLLIYLPMKANYERSGCLMLECDSREAGE